MSAPCDAKVTNLIFGNVELDFIGLPATVTVGDRSRSPGRAPMDSVHVAQTLVDVADGNEGDAVVDKERQLEKKEG